MVKKYKCFKFHIDPEKDKELFDTLISIPTTVQLAEYVRHALRQLMKSEKYGQESLHQKDEEVVSGKRDTDVFG